jgi:F0F1-type ATP synthase membrane subunit b/b'
VAETHSETKNENLSYSLDGYKNKLEEIIRAENEKFRLLAEQQAKEITSEAWTKAEETLALAQKKTSEIIGNSEKKAGQIVSDSQRMAEKLVAEHREKAQAEQSEIIQRARNEAAAIIEKSKMDAQGIVNEAEENARKEAKLRVKVEGEKILLRTKKESESILALAQEKAGEIEVTARKDAELQTRAALEQSQKEVEVLIKEQIEKCRADAQAQAMQIRKATEKDAEWLLDEIINSSQELNGMITGSIGKTENMLARAKNDVMVEFGELTKRLTETRAKVEARIDSFARGSSGELAESTGTSNNIWVITKGEKSAGDEKGFFTGEIELKTLSSFDIKRIKKMKSLFTQIPSVEYLGEVSSEDGVKIAYKLQEPLPLLDILRTMPSVDRVVEEGNGLKLTVM